MASIRTGNNNRARAHRREVRDQAWAFDEAYFIRLAKSGRLDKRVNSGFVRRTRARDKAFVAPFKRMYWL